MAKNEIIRKVNTILVDELGVESKYITPDASLENDLGADSLDEWEIMIELEKEFGIDVPGNEMDGLRSCKVKDIYEFVENKL